MAKKSIIETKVAPEQFSFVINSGIKVYPISYFDEDELRLKRFIQVDNNGKITTYNKEVPQRELNDAVAKTIIHFYKQLTKDQNE